MVSLVIPLPDFGSLIDLASQASYHPRENIIAIAATNNVRVLLLIRCLTDVDVMTHLALPLLSNFMRAQKTFPRSAGVFTLEIRLGTSLVFVPPSRFSRFLPELQTFFPYRHQIVLD